jgi:hypothetical protein
VTGLITYVLGVLMTFLPPRYRSHDAGLRGEAMTAGILEFLSALGVLLYRFFIFSWQRAGLIGLPVDAPSNRPEVNAVFGGGVFMMADFLFTPLNAFLVYLFFEGVIRVMSALVGHQVFGTLPLYVISGVHGLVDKARYKRYLGPLVADEVVRGGPRQSHDLKVYSCRPKLHWNPYMTVQFEGEFYQYFKEEYGPPPRRFIYYLRKNPVGRIVVVVDQYRVDSEL